MVINCISINLEKNIVDELMKIITKITTETNVLEYEGNGYTSLLCIQMNESSPWSAEY
jgi:hypothetical protein